jgi:hypothetical protein
MGERGSARIGAKRCGGAIRSAKCSTTSWRSTGKKLTEVLRLPDKAMLARTRLGRSPPDTRHGPTAPLLSFHDKADATSMNEASIPTVGWTPSSGGFQ